MRHEMGFPQRYPRQPWTYDARDLASMGDPETVIFLPAGETIVGLHVIGLREGDKMIGIRCDELGRPESCAVTNDAMIATPVRVQPFNAPYFDHVDGVSDEDPA